MARVYQMMQSRGKGPKLRAGAWEWDQAQQDQVESGWTGGLAAWVVGHGSLERQGLERPRLSGAMLGMNEACKGQGSEGAMPGKGMAWNEQRWEKAKPGKANFWDKNPPLIWHSYSHGPGLTWVRTMGPHAGRDGLQSIHQGQEPIGYKALNRVEFSWMTRWERESLWKGNI